MSGAGQYDNTTLIGNWYEDRLHRRTNADGQQVTTIATTLHCATLHCTTAAHLVAPHFTSHIHSYVAYAVLCCYVLCCAAQLHHIHRYRATPIAMELPAGYPPDSCLRSHASEQYGRKQIIQPQPTTSFAATNTLHTAIERPNQQHIQQTQLMQRKRVLPPFNKQADGQTVHSQQRTLHTA